jgi:hypothetical protein
MKRFLAWLQRFGVCEDCGRFGLRITKGDHHGGTKTVCSDRAACNLRGVP